MQGVVGALAEESMEETIGSFISHFSGVWNSLVVLLCLGRVVSISTLIHRALVDKSISNRMKDRNKREGGRRERKSSDSIDFESGGGEGKSGSVAVWRNRISGFFLLPISLSLSFVTFEIWILRDSRCIENIEKCVWFLLFRPRPLPSASSRLLVVCFWLIFQVYLFVRSGVCVAGAVKRNCIWVGYWFAQVKHFNWGRKEDLVNRRA